MSHALRPWSTLDGWGGVPSAVVEYQSKGVRTGCLATVRVGMASCITFRKWKCWSGINKFEWTQGHCLLGPYFHICYAAFPISSMSVGATVLLMRVLGDHAISFRRLVPSSGALTLSMNFSDTWPKRSLLKHGGSKMGQGVTHRTCVWSSLPYYSGPPLTGSVALNHLPKGLWTGR